MDMIGAIEAGNSQRLAANLARILALITADPDAPPVPALPADEDGDRLGILSHIFGLSPFECDVLILCAGMALDAGIANEVALRGAPAEPTFGFALAVLPAAHWSALSPTAPLRHWRLIEIGEGASLATRPLRISEAILHFLIGLPQLDERLQPIVEIPSLPDTPGEGLHSAASGLARQADGNGIAGHLRGGSREAHRQVAAMTSAFAGAQLLVLELERLPSDPAAVEELARLLDRERLMLGVWLMIEANLPAGTLWEDWRVRRLARDFQGTTILSSPAHPGPHPVHIVDLGALSAGSGA